MTGPVEPRTLRFPSVEKFLVAYLPTITGDVETTTELPHDFQHADSPLHMLPVIFVERISGADLNPILDRPVVDVDVYAGNRGDAQDIAETIRNDLRFNLPGTAIVGGLVAPESLVVTRTRTIVAPRILPHANPRVYRYSANYELVLHAVP